MKIYEGTVEEIKEYFSRHTHDHDGCVGCKYEDKGWNDPPCKECNQNYRDMWRPKGWDEGNG